MSENIASSTWLGARPSFSQTSAYSASVRPRATASSSPGGDIAVTRSRGRPDALGRDVAGWDKAHRPEDDQAVLRPRERVHRVLGMRHEPEDVARLVADAGDVARRAVMIGRIAQDHLVGDGVEVGREVAAGRVL